MVITLLSVSNVHTTQTLERCRISQKATLVRERKVRMGKDWVDRIFNLKQL